ncbi:MAG: SDR family oxidoreductase [Sedimentisphaerales bacterium]|nr:SDR family oxidoreductase [Sedimentisphaerales bacterium]
MGLLENKTIVVTGGSMGIGLAVAQQCAKEGALLILISRHRGDLEKALSTLDNGRMHGCFALDVGSLAEVSKTARIIAKERGLIDGLVNCAGVYGPIGAVDEVNPAEFADAIRINLLGTFYMCHYFVPLLKRAKRGKIVNYSGGGAAGPFPRFSAYAAGKAAIVRLTENTALELRQDNIDVNAVAPGFVVTRLHQQTLEAGDKAGRDFLQKTNEQIAKGGVPPTVAAELTAFLLSPAADGITGKFISAPWDLWQKQEFIDKLKADPDFTALRRIDDKTFFKVSNPAVK